MEDVLHRLQGQQSVALLDSSQGEKYCWVCFATEEDDSTAQWVQPCKCRGTTRWVHESCLQRWVDEKQKGNAAERVNCPQCNTYYVIVFPPMGKLVLVLDVIDQVVYRICPFVAAGLVMGSIYWTAVTYGALTFMQVVGSKEGMSIMEHADPLFLLIGLPTIPVLLVLGRMVRWEEAILNFLTKNIPRLPLFKYMLPSFQVSTTVRVASVEVPPLSDPVCATRVLCGALIFPSMAVFMGKVLFNSSRSGLQRAFLGGVAFLAAKGVFKIYYKHQTQVRQSRRRVLDFAKTGLDAAPTVSENDD